MATNGKFLSKDGQWYDTAQEMWSANSAWDVKQTTQEKQNRLLQQQNRLMEQQMQMQYELEQEKIQKNYEKEMKKMQHDEKMRLYKLFDDIGISKDTYDTFINTNFLNKTNITLMEQRDEHLLTSSKYDFLLHEDENEEKYGFDNYDATMERYDMYDLKEKVENDCYSSDKNKQNELHEQVDKLKMARSRHIKIIVSLFLISVLIWIMAFILDTDTLFVLGFLGYFISIIYLIIVLCIINTKIQNIESDSSYTSKIDYQKYLSKLKKLIKEEEKLANKILDMIKSNCEETINDLYNFRINHYNSNIEKLLVDVGFKELIESLGLEYTKVNNSNKKKNGTIEDYIEYFETNS